MRRLLLLRHAKSDWSVALPDNERQLNPRGRKAADRMGRYIQCEGLAPDKVLCSPAFRAAETWRLVQPCLKSKPKVEHIEALYDFGSGTALLDIIRQSGGDAQTLMLVGHNPSVEGLANLLVGTGDPAALAGLQRKYPTAALAVIDFEIVAWHEIAPSTGTLTSFIRPKKLED